MDMLPLENRPEPVGEAVPNNQDIPRDEMNIFERLPSDFLPPGKTIGDLTPEEQRDLQQKFRFSPYRPGEYQAITSRGPY